MGQSSIEITQSARNKIIDLLEEEDNNNLKLRTFVQGGGCSGFQYGFTLDEEQNDDDFIIPINEKFSALIDSYSMQYLQGSVIDYTEDTMGSNFSIKNPNAESTCGCGNSFSI